MMSRIRKLATAAGTFSLALGIGFVMQNGDVLAARFGAAPSAPAGMTSDTAAADLARTPVDPMAMPSLPGLRPAATPVMTSAAFAIPAETPAPALALAGDGSVGLFPAALLDAPPAPEAQVPAPAARPDCTGEMTAETLPAGLIALRLAAPCAPLERVSFHHRGLSFTELTDAEGFIDVIIPALAEQAVILADIPGGTGAVAMTEVPEIATLDRAVLQWQGEAGLNLHALEYGADYGEEGHVWAGAPRVAGAAEGGFLIELGDPGAPGPHLAQVYTFPHGNAGRPGSVALSIDAEVTAANCGRGISAQSLQIAPGTEPVAHDLTLQMPDCAMAGDLLIVSGMLSDLHLAAN